MGTRYLVITPLPHYTPLGRREDGGEHGHAMALRLPARGGAALHRERAATHSVKATPTRRPHAALCGRPAPPKRLIGRGWPKLRAA